jgi:protein-L-isoaspartate(D-aspartate) O-methyltransferase
MAPIGAGVSLSDTVQEALRLVPRQAFVPGTAPAEADVDGMVTTRQDGDGHVVGCLSQPSIVALRLGQLAVQPGHRVLEIGAGSGYRAALLAHLAGPRGHVTTIEIDAHMVTAARCNLASTGAGTVEVVLGDGALGHQAGAPYDRIIATVGTYGVPDNWLSQLAPAGRLVAPVRLGGSVAHSIAFERDQCGRWRSVGSEMCPFIPMRGIADDTRQTLALTSDDAIRLEIHQDQAVDPDALVDVLRQRRVTAWTGVHLGEIESMEWLYLWLTCTLPNALSRMTVDWTGVEHEVIAPQFGWGAMATVEQRNLAYLTARTHDDVPNGEILHEIGVIGHGPRGDDVVDRFVREIRAWDRGYRSVVPEFEIQPTATTSGTYVGGESDVLPVLPTDSSACFAIPTPHQQIIVTWRSPQELPTGTSRNRRKTESNSDGKHS